MLLAREIGRERHDHRGDRAPALQRTSGDRSPDVGGAARQEAAGGEDHEAGDDHGLAPPAVGGHAERQLQHGLREAVGAERGADQRQVVAARELRRVHREHRQDQEQPEHAQAEDARERGARTHFLRAHALGMHLLGASLMKKGWKGGRLTGYSSKFPFALRPFMDSIRIRGARTHNLKNINLELPRHRLVVITGLSGSGKSSLAFDTLYAEGQRRYVESLSAYARQFLQLMEKPDVDLIEGLSPAISIEQKSASHNPRSTVGTVTEIHDYLRLLFARVGTPYCPEHKLPLQSQSVSQMVDATLALPEDTKVIVLAPVVRDRKGEFVEFFDDMQTQGFVRFRIDGAVVEADDLPPLAKNEKHSLDVVVDRLKVRSDAKQRLAESFETALRLADGRALLLDLDNGQETLFSSRFSCPVCSYSLSELEPRLFSFNNPMGACTACDGIGTVEFFDEKRVVAHPDLSLASGAIKGWDARNQYYYQMLAAVAQHHGFDIDLPFEELPEAARHAILHGTGDDEIAFTYTNERGRRMVRRH